MAAVGEVVIVSGPPGAGKTTVASRLAEAVEPSVHLDTDAFYRWIRAGYQPPHQPQAHQQNITVIDAVAGAAAVYAAAGYQVFCDGVIGPWFLDRITDRLHPAALAVHYLVLRPGREQALARVAARDASATASGAATMWDQFADLGDLEAHVVPSNGPVDQVVDACRTALADQRMRIYPDHPNSDDPAWPVSVKAILAWDGQVIVLRNRRGEWELPGGRLEPTDPTPQGALRRELREELAVDAKVGDLVDSWIYDVADRRVLILTYLCEATRPATLTHSSEHTDVALLTIDQLAAGPLPNGYLDSIRTALGARPSE